MDASAGNIAGVRMNAGGSILGGGEFGIAGWADPETNPRVAASRLANQWLVVWQSDTGSPNFLDIFARRVWVDGSGAIQQSGPVIINNTTGTERRPDVSSYPESPVFGISWEQEYSGSNFGIWARTMDISDHLGETTVVRTSSIGQTIDSKNPSMAASPKGFLTVWQQERESSSAIDIYGRVMWRLFSDGFESGDFTGWSSVSP